MRWQPGQVSPVGQVLPVDLVIRDRDHLQPDRDLALEPAGREIARRQADESLRLKRQSPALRPGFSIQKMRRRRLLDRRDLAELALERLVGFLWEVGVRIA